MKKIFIYSVLFLTYFGLYAQPPTGYYDGTTGLSGQELKVKLHKIISGHTVYTYSEAKDVLMDLDEDPANTANIQLIYKGTSIPKENFSTNNEPDFWNREHTWPKSHGFPDIADTAYTDVHMLRPSDASINSDRSNKDFNNVEHTAENTHNEAPDTYTTADFWEPRDEVKGDLARIMFYMDARYESSFFDLELVDRISHSNDPELGVLYTLLSWHEQDPVSQEEIDRNEGAYGYQNNRNPFVDHPEWIGEIWGTTTVPLIILNTESFNADFGRVQAGNSLVQMYSVNLYQLTSDVTISAAAPFELSLDNVNWSSSVVIANDAAQDKQMTDVYLKYAPVTADEAVHNVVVTHASTGASTVEMAVTGQEGEIPLQTIADARTKSLGDAVYVTGVVIDKQNNNSASRVIYDGTAGIVVRSFDAGNESAPLVYGDSITVSGILGEYNGLLQISESPVTINLIKQNASVPEPQEVTIANIGESYESELVVVKEVRFVEAGSTFGGGGSAGNFTITDGTDQITFRIGSSGHPLVGTEVPSGIYDVVGFVGQFGSDYQLSPRSADDLIFITNDNTPLTSIAEARAASVGNRVKVTGVVIDAGNNSADNRTIYDGTAGIVVRSFDVGNESAPLVKGDSITVSGVLSEYNGMLQISQSPIYIELHKQNVSLPAPQSVTIPDIGEEMEAELVTIENVKFTATGNFQGGGTNGEYQISDGTNSFLLKIGLTTHPLVGSGIPQEMLRITGVIGQSGTDYYISPRDANDLEVIETVTGISEDKRDDVVVYPNPVQDRLYITLSDNYRVKVTDVTGKTVVHLNKVTNGFVDVSILKEGIYILNIVSKEKNRSYRIIKK